MLSASRTISTSRLTYLGPPSCICLTVLSGEVVGLDEDHNGRRDGRLEPGTGNGTAILFPSEELRGHDERPLARGASLVEQNARLALEISYRAYVFEVGRIALNGESRTLSEDPRIKKAYLGA